MDCRVIMWAAENCELCFPPSLPVPTQGGSAGYGELCKNVGEKSCTVEILRHCSFWPDADGLQWRNILWEVRGTWRHFFLENAVFHSLPNHSAVKSFCHVDFSTVVYSTSCLLGSTEVRSYKVHFWWN